MTPEKFAERIAATKSHKSSKRGLASERLRRNTDVEREKRNAYARKWRKSEKYRKKVSDRSRIRRKVDPMFCLAERVRARLREAMANKSIGKRSKTIEIIGCDWPVLAAHIESQFQPGMSWENRSEWHVDHIIPLSSATNEDEILKLSHYTNLQPLWAMDNLKKGAKICPHECLDQAVYLRRAIAKIDEEENR